MPCGRNGVPERNSAWSIRAAQTGLFFFAAQPGNIPEKAVLSLRRPGSVVCLPEESEYAVLNLSDGKEPDYPDAYLIEFRAFSQKIPLTFGDSPFLIKNANFVLLRELAEKTVLACEAPMNSPCTVRAGIYEMLSLLGRKLLGGRKQAFFAHHAGNRIPAQKSAKLAFGGGACKDVPRQQCQFSQAVQGILREESGKLPY